jgi:hypothetical protein
MQGDHILNTLKKKLTYFATKSGAIIISSRTAGSTLQKRSLLYLTQKNQKQTQKKTFFDGVEF